MSGAAELRAAFDASFGRPARAARGAEEDLLVVRAGELLALRAAEVAGVMRCPPMIALPSRNAALCGLVAVRGAPVAVYSLARLAGRPGGAVRGGFIVSSKADRTAALWVDELVGYERVSSAAIVREASGSGVTTTAVVSIEAAPITMLGMSALLERVRQLAGMNKE